MNRQKKAHNIRTGVLYYSFCALGAQNLCKQPEIGKFADLTLYLHIQYSKICRNERLKGQLYETLFKFIKL